MRVPDASVISSWPVPNYTNPETFGPAAYIVIGVLLFLVTVLLAIRIYTRIWISNGFGADDVLILLAYLPTAAFAILSFVSQAEFGLGRHVWDVPFQDFTPNLQINLASQLMFDLSTTLTKLSILALIWRIVSIDKGPYRYAVIVVLIIVSLDGLIFFFLTLFQCSPVEAYWILSFGRQECIDERMHLLLAGIINTTSDFLLVVLPIPSILRMSLPRKQQIIVAILFAGGLFATVAGAVRTVMTYRFLDSSNSDLTFNGIPVLIVSALELFIGIMCASIPPTKPFFARYLPGLIGHSMSWLSRTSHTRTTLPPGGSQKLEPDYWTAASARNSTIADKYEPEPLEMQTRGVLPPRDNSTPLRPLHSQSTMRSIPMQAPHNSNPRTFASPSQQSDYSMLSMTTTSTGILNRSPSAATGPLRLNPVNLNKPLPPLGPPSGSQWANMDEGLDWEENDARRATSENMLSVFKLVPHGDGHISVHMARESDESP